MFNNLRKQYVEYGREKNSFSKKLKKGAIASAFAFLAMSMNPFGVKDVYAATNSEEFEQVESVVTDSIVASLGDEVYAKEGARIYRNEYDLAKESNSLKMSNPDTAKKITEKVYLVDGEPKKSYNTETEEKYANNELLGYLVNGNEGFLLSDDIYTLVDEIENDVKSSVEESEKVSQVASLGDVVYAKEGARLHRNEYDLAKGNNSLKMSNPETAKKITEKVYLVDGEPKKSYNTETEEKYANNELLGYLVNGNEGFLPADYIYSLADEVKEDEISETKKNETVEINTSVELASPSNATPSNATVASPSNATPSNATVASPSNATVASPSNVTPSNATVASPSNATPSNATVATASKATESNAVVVSDYFSELGKFFSELIPTEPRIVVLDGKLATESNADVATLDHATLASATVASASRATEASATVASPSNATPSNATVATASKATESNATVVTNHFSELGKFFSELIPTEPRIVVLDGKLATESNADVATLDHATPSNATVASPSNATPSNATVASPSNVTPSNATVASASKATESNAVVVSDYFSELGKFFSELIPTEPRIVVLDGKLATESNADVATLDHATLASAELASPSNVTPSNATVASASKATESNATVATTSNASRSISKELFACTHNLQNSLEKRTKLLEYRSNLMLLKNQKKMNLVKPIYEKALVRNK